MAPDFTERYVLRHLALIDMERAIASLDHRAKLRNEHVRDALLRDAVISYAKPFSGNRGLTSRGLKISEGGIPKMLRAKHKELMGYRNQLFAHMDLDRQQPKMSKDFGFSVVGYAKVHADHLVAPLRKLAKKVHAHLITELFAMRKGHV